MKTSKIIYLFPIFALLFSACKQDTEKQASQKQMLEEFYRFYINEVANGDPETIQAHLNSVQQANCTKALQDSIAREYENGLDYDPFINAQDADESTLKTLTVKPVGDKGKFSIQFTNASDHKTTTINVKVTEDNGRFKIASLQ